MAEKRFFPASIADETAYLMEGTAHTSITWGCILTLEGEVSFPAIHSAMDYCLECYPKFKCILTSAYPSFKRWFRYCWEYQDITSKDMVQEIEDPCRDEDNNQGVISCYRYYYSLHAIDVTRRPPLKLLLLRRPPQVYLIFLVHHTACDGLGFLIFLQKFIQCYEWILYHGKPLEECTPAIESISRPLVIPPWRQRSLTQLRNFISVKSLFFREPSTRVHMPGPAEPAPALMAVTRDIPPPQFQALRTAAKNAQVTLNDYLLAAMFRTITQWNRQYGETPGRIYINVPVNLRRPDDQTVGNILCGYDTSLAPTSIGNTQAMLKLIHDEKIFMMENEIATIALRLTWLFKFLPLPLKRFMLTHHSTAIYPSLCLSNLGICSPNPSHHDEEGFHYMGAARIQSIMFISFALLWPQVLVFTYNNRMYTSVSCFQSPFSLAAAGRFLDTFVGELTT